MSSAHELLQNNLTGSGIDSSRLPDAQSVASPKPDQVLEALRKITGSKGFDSTERSRKLLEYVVLEALAGRGNRIKAYSIATEVLGRPESFDPQKDPIVRVEGGRLRRALEHYYLTDGVHDTVRIDIPKGGYVPVFSLHEAAYTTDTAAAPAPKPPVAPAGEITRARIKHPAVLGVLLVGALSALIGWISLDDPATPETMHMPGVVIKPFVDLSPTEDSALILQGLTERIIEKTTRFREIAVVAGDTSDSRAPVSMARYEFGGTARITGEKLMVQTRLVDRTDGRVIWADSVDASFKPREVSDAEMTIANQIAARIGEPDGIVFEAERRLAVDAPPGSWTAYNCTLHAYAYRASFSAEQFAPVRSCLEKAVAEFPNYATAWALLSLSYIDEVRFFYPPPEESSTPALTRAAEAAKRAIELDPANVRGQQAMMMALFFQKRYPQAIEAGQKALALNPNDIELKGDFGYRLALTGQWDDGCKLVQEAFNASMRKAGYYQTALALCAYMKNDYQTAADLIRQASASENPAYHVIASAILAEAGDTKDAAENRAWLERNAPSQYPKLLVQLPERLVQPADSERFRQSLRKAGFAEIP